MSFNGYAACACTSAEGCRAGGQGPVLASTMPRAQNRAAKGSTLIRRRSTLPIWVNFFSVVVPHGSYVVQTDHRDQITA